MTDTQLYLAIGIPVLFNGFMFLVLFSYINGKFADYKEVWKAELKRVEEVLDARLKHLEEK